MTVGELEAKVEFLEWLVSERDRQLAELRETIQNIVSQRGK